MKFKEIKIGELLDFIASDLYKNSHHLPITKERAISQYHNPRAEKEDMALLLALDDVNQIIGYIGALPEKLAQNPDIKVTWNSGWWVDSKKGKHVAMPLFFKFLSIWKNNVLFSDMTPKTKAILFRLNQFKVIKPLHGYRYFVRVNTAHVLPEKNKLFSYIKPLLQLGDLFVNTAMTLAFRLKLAIHHNQTKIGKITYHNTIDTESATFIHKHNTNELIQREAKELNWILQYPWVKEGKETPLSKRYYFSQFSPVFKNYIVKLYDKSNELTAVLFLNNNNSSIKLPYLFYKKEHKEMIVSFLYQFLIKEKAISFTTYNKQLTHAISQQKGRPFWLKKAVSREFVVSNTLIDYVDYDFEFQEGNSDVVFT